MGVLYRPQLPLPPSLICMILSDNSLNYMEMAGTLANWSCAGVCGEVMNLTLCCVASCE